MPLRIQDTRLGSKCCIWLACIWLASTAAVAGTEHLWSRHTIDDSSRGADGVKLADVNADGRPDIVTGWEEGGITRAYLHPGSADANKPWPAVTVGQTPSVEDAVWADLDADGAVDIVTCCEGKARTAFFHWAPPVRSDLLSATAWQRRAVPITADRMQWMFAQPLQVDNAHGLDLILAGKGKDAQLGWLQAPAQPRDVAAWRWHPICSVGWVMSILPTDMDGDGDIDTLITDRRGPDRGCRWLENPGPGPSQTEPWRNHPIGGNDVEVMFATVADLDHDGWQDVLVAAKPRQILYLRRLDPSGKRWASSTIAFPENMGTAKGIAVEDVDSDSRPDIVISCEGATAPRSGLRWLSYRQSPFETHWQGHDIAGPDGIKFDRIELLDIDTDGDLDVLTCEERHEGRGLGVVWYENPINCP